MKQISNKFLAIVALVCGVLVAGGVLALEQTRATPPQQEFTIEMSDNLDGVLYFEVSHFFKDDGNYAYRLDRATGELTPYLLQNFGMMHEPHGDGLHSVYVFGHDQWRTIRPDAIPGADGGYIQLMRDGKTIKTITDENGFDVHEFVITDDGNYVYLRSHITPHYGNEDSTLTCFPAPCGVLSQSIIERTPSGETITEIHLIDAYERADFVMDDVMIRGDMIVYDVTHANSVQVNADGYLVSIRHTNEVIQYAPDGSILWRSRDYSFDPAGSAFAHQHDAQILDNGNLLLFDNGNGLRDVSRAVEYQIDHEQKTLIQVWSYITPDAHFAPNRGGVQRLPDGNTIINFVDYGIVEVTADGETVMHITMPPNYASYQARLDATHNTRPD